MSTEKAAVNPFTQLATTLVAASLVAGVVAALVEPRFGLLAAAVIFGWTQLGTI